MFTLHLLGHVRATVGDRELQLSAKSAALLAYLALEHAPQSRERVARLLWEKRDGLSNLRVELTRIRHQGLDVFPARASELDLNCSVDVEQFLSGAPAGEGDLEGWLGWLRGPPLRGLDEVGTPEFQRWVVQRRSALLTQLNHALCVAYTREIAAGRAGRAEAIRMKARQAGIGLVGELQGAGRTAPTGAQTAQREALALALARAGQSGQLVMVTGRHGSGRCELVQEVVTRGGWPLVQVTATANRRMLQSALAQAIWRVAPPGEAPTLQQVMRSPGDADDDLMRLLSVLMSLGGPAVLVVYRADIAPEGFLDGLACTVGSGGPLVGVLVTDRPAALARFASGPARAARVHLPPLGPRDVMQLLEGAGRAARNEGSSREAPGQGAFPRPEQSVGLLERQVVRLPERHAVRLAQHSEGWLAYLQALVNERDAVRDLIGGEVGGAPDVSEEAFVPAAAGEVLAAEAAQWPPDLREALALLAVHPAAFDVDVARVALGMRPDDPDVHSLLNRAHGAGLLRRAPATETLLLPGLQQRAPDGEAPLVFASELQRRALEAGVPVGLKRELRARLASLLLPARPDVSAYLAALAGDEDLAGRALRRHLASLPLNSPLRAGMAAQGSVGEPVPDVPAPDGRARQEVGTGNGYRVAVDGGRLEVLRFGPPASPPLLQLRFGPQPAGGWRLVLRVDVFDGSGGAPCLRMPYPLAVGTPVTCTLLTPNGAPWVFQEDGVQYRVPGALRVGEWVEVRGEHPGGPLELRARAAEVGLTLAAFSCAGRELLP